jgi:hypothetical protein
MSNLKCFKFNFRDALNGLVSLLAALLIVIFTQPARAETATNAITAAAADTASTAAALASGFTELNPLGLAGTVLTKVATIAFIDQLPEEDRAAPYGWVSAFWGGAAASNLCWLTGAGPLCFALGIATGSYMWSNGEEDRSYWASCKIKRQGNPATPCGRSDQNPNDHKDPVLALAP